MREYLSQKVNVYGGLWYYPDINRFVDCNGNVIHNIYRILEPWVLEAWKRYCENNMAVYQRVRDVNGRLIDLHYPEKEADLETLDFIREHSRVFPDKV